MEKKEEDLNVTQEQIEAIRREALDELRMHFVFNTLNGIRFLIRTDPEAAYRVVYDLAQFLQNDLQMVAVGGSVPLQEEFSFVEAYIKLEQMQKRKIQLVICREGSQNFNVEYGSIYRAVEKLLKEDVYKNRQDRTLIIQISDSAEVVKVGVRETGKGVEIPLIRRNIE